MSIESIYTSIWVATNYLDCCEGSAQTGLDSSGSALLTSCSGKNMISVSKKIDLKRQWIGTRAPAKLREEEKRGTSQKLLLPVIL